MNDLNLQTILMAHVILGNAVTFSTGPNSLDLYLRFVLSSFPRWNRILIRLKVCLNQLWGWYLL